MHKVADAITDAVGVPFVHIADTTADAVRRAGHDTVGLLATAYTMEQDFYVGRLRDRHGLTVITPGANDRATVHRVIYEELCVGVVSDASREEYRRIMRALADEGARRSCSAVPRSTCWSARRTRPCRCSTPPACTPSARSNSPSRASRYPPVRGKPGRAEGGTVRI